MARVYREPEDKVIYPAASYDLAVSNYHAVSVDPADSYTSGQKGHLYLGPDSQQLTAPCFQDQEVIPSYKLPPGKDRLLEARYFLELTPRKVCPERLTWRLTACRIGGLPKLDLLRCLFMILFFLLLCYPSRTTFTVDVM